MPDFDASINDSWQLTIRDFYARQRDERNSEWRRKYEAHLQSHRWRELRAMVLKRCNRVCEGCGAREAVQAHHLTYERLGDEMLFDLVGVCLICHEKIHGRPIGR